MFNVELTILKEDELTIREPYSAIEFSNFFTSRVEGKDTITYMVLVRGLDDAFYEFLDHDSYVYEKIWIDDDRENSGYETSKLQYDGTFKSYYHLNSTDGMITISSVEKALADGGAEEASKLILEALVDRAPVNFAAQKALKEKLLLNTYVDADDASSLSI